MEKKQYKAPLTEISLIAIESHFMAISKEEWIDPGHSDAKEQGGFFEDDAFGDTWGDNEDSKDLWE